MVNAVIDVDRTITHLSDTPRVAAGAPRLDRLGYFPAKTEAIDRTFRQVSLSLVTHGTGRLEHADRRWRVAAHRNTSGRPRPSTVGHGEPQEPRMGYRAAPR